MNVSLINNPGKKFLKDNSVTVPTVIYIYIKAGTGLRYLGTRTIRTL